MFPIALQTNVIDIALVGRGPSLLRRLKQLDDAGSQHIKIFSDDTNQELKNMAGDRLVDTLPYKEELTSFHVVMIVDIEAELATAYAKHLRGAKILVNIEDVPEYCDFYFSSQVRRGNLLFAINTNGKSPALSQRLRKILEQLFPSYWADRVEDIAAKRTSWKQEGASFKEVIDKSNDYMDKQGWFEHLPKKEATNA